MFICINQVIANGKNQFEINIDGTLKYCADTPWFSAGLPFGIENIKKLKFMNTDGEMIYTTDYSVVENTLESMIPFKYLFKEGQKFMQMNILDKYNENRGSICTKMNGILESNLCFTFNNEVFLGYDVSKGKIRTISVYKDNLEIAQITKPLSVKDNLDNYYIHIIDEYSYIAEVISFFVIYFDYCNYRNSNQLVVHKNEVSVEYTYNKNNKFYNKSWIKEQFGDAEYSRFTNLLQQRHDVIKKEVANTTKLVLFLCGVIWCVILLGAVVVFLNKK